jgi:serine phosphatase RsbU (regulator of sigma subunit)
MRQVQIAVAKTHKYASRESGDTVEIVERPHGGLSVLLVDAQGSGFAAKTISNLVISRGAAMIKEGMRDGAVARAVHDYLYTLRQGRVSATLIIVSVDLQSQSLILSRNDECPVYVFAPGRIDVHDEPSTPIGIYIRSKPVVVQEPLADYLGVVVTSDGVTGAGERHGARFDVYRFLQQRLEQGWPVAQDLADATLEQAMALEDGRPRDDASVVVVMLTPVEDRDSPPVRRLIAHLPVE